ncbi:GIY-YIG nuclease family protein [uncultured Aquimarina sp.]|uniref:GIY-YIG nuclease family protein n=1 Tax=uncultured Aquimarina sp. TaxID=575652 RepID=UPI0026109B29|nr:GIY-YIG nuclease family protein [uncultured Aquimarina sp.]
MKQYYVYIIKCKDNSFYVGITNNLERRTYEHNKGLNQDCYTFNRKPVELKWFETFIDPNQAIKIEKQLKGWSRRKKIALIEKDWDKLIEFSKNYTEFGNQIE